MLRRVALCSLNYAATAAGVSITSWLVALVAITSAWDTTRPFRQALQ